jgi:hypothetical protein
MERMVMTTVPSGEYKDLGGSAERPVGDCGELEDAVLADGAVGVVVCSRSGP